MILQVLNHVSTTPPDLHCIYKDYIYVNTLVNWRALTLYE